MNTKKFEYLETIRELIDLGDYEELKDYVEMIRERVRSDSHFQEILQEMNNEKYQEVISLIDDIIYQEMQEDYEVYEEKDDDESEEVSEEDLKNFEFNIDFDTALEEEISFESFDEEGFIDKAEEDLY